MQWSKYMRDSQNKIELIKFLFDDWSSGLFAENIGQRIIFFNIGNHFRKIYNTAENKVCFAIFRFKFTNHLSSPFMVQNGKFVESTSLSGPHSILF